MDGFVVSNSVNLLLVFMEGILSFFSPCVIPLLPVYMSYLAGSGKKLNEDGTIRYDRKKVFLHTVFFALGISFAFFILGMTFTALGNFFSAYRLTFTRIGGIIVIVLGLFQLGVLDFAFLQRERKLNISLEDRKMNPLIALLLGFTFSFAWTPCIGPMLSSVLIMASGAKTALQGNLLVLVYTAGFLIPFLLLGLFTTQALNFLKGKQKLLKYAVKAGGVILIIMGIMIFTGWMNSISGYLNSFRYDNSGINEDKETEGTKGEAETEDAKNPTDAEKVEDAEGAGNTDDTRNSDEIVNNGNPGDADNDKDTGNADTSQSKDERELIPAFDFTLTDQYGNEHTLSDYKGKVVFLNFWATWCGPCQDEMPAIEELYQEYNKNKDDVILLGIANPSTEEYPNNNDVSIGEIEAFLNENGYTFPTVYDVTGDTLISYRISAFPTTFMIDKEGNIFGYVPGKMTKDIMINIINQTLEASE